MSTETIIQMSVADLVFDRRNPRLPEFGPRLSDTAADWATGTVE